MSDWDIDLDFVAHAMHDRGDEYYFNRRSKQVTSAMMIADGVAGELDDDFDEDDDLIPIETVYGSIAHRDMERFAEMIRDEALRIRMERAMSGRGGFRRFRDVVFNSSRELGDRWLRFEDCRHKRRAAEWLRDAEVIDQATADALVAKCDATYDAIDAELAAVQDSDLRAVVKLERQLLAHREGAHAAPFIDLLNTHFVEITVDGAVLDCAATIAEIDRRAVAPDPRGETTTMHDPVATRVADGLVEIRWRSERAGRAALRTSLWSSGDDGWKVLRHQATPIAPD